MTSDDALVRDQGPSGSAVFSTDRRYRYALTRDLVAPGMMEALGAKTVLFVMLNPSTADAFVLDPTIKRCVGFATRWGYQRLVVTNLFALRSTDPRVLEIEARWAPGPIAHDGPMQGDHGNTNDQIIVEQATSADLIVCAWGNHGELLRRGENVATLLRSWHHLPLHYLRLTASGQPEHPLYLPGDLAPVPWTA